MSRYWAIWPYHPDDPETLTVPGSTTPNKARSLSVGISVRMLVQWICRSSRRMSKIWPDEPGAASMVWKLYNEIAVGDTVIAVRKRTEFVGVVP